jgi:replicative DNA helicase
VGDAELKERLENSVFDICDRGSLRVSQIAAIANNYDLIVVDYLQILETADKVSGLYEKATNLSNDLRKAAKNSNAAWLVLSQLSRKMLTEHETPKLSHLRDSGAIEQDAFTVLFLHYPEKPVQNDKGEYAANRYVVVTIAKNRSGGFGQFAYRFCPSRSTWEPMTIDEVESFENDEKNRMNTEYNRGWMND